jgi:PDZ domain-containing secreted protein
MMGWRCVFLLRFSTRFLWFMVFLCFVRVGVVLFLPFLTSISVFLPFLFVPFVLSFPGHQTEIRAILTCVPTLQDPRQG